MGQNLCGQVETENLCRTDDNLHWSYVAAKDEKYNSIDLLYDEKSCLNSKKRHNFFMKFKRMTRECIDHVLVKIHEFDMDKSFKKETTKNTEHLDFEDIFTGDGNTDTRQKIVSDYNSDSDVESESDDHNTAMKTTCFDKPEPNTFIPIHKMPTLSKSFIDIHEQPIEISRQKNIEDLSEQYSQDALALTKMNISQNLRSEIHEVPERQVVSGFLSDHNCIYGKVYKEWQDGDDPYVIHQQISPICPYMNGQESENVPIYKEDGLQPRHHIDPTLVPSTTPVNQARVAAEAATVRIPGLSSSEISRILVSGSAGQGRLLGTSQSGDFLFRFLSTQPGSRGPTPPQEPNRKSQTLDQSTHGPRSSPEKQSPPQTRPDLRGSTLPQEPNRKSPTLDQSTHWPRGSPEKQSPPETRPDLRGSTLPQEPNRKSPTLDQSTHVPTGSPEKQSPPQTRPDLRGSTLPQEPNRKSPTLDQSTHVPSGSPEKQSSPQTRPDLRGSTLPQEPNRKSPTLDQSTHVPSGSVEKQSPPQTRPDLRGSTLPQEPNRKSPTLDQSTHGPRGSPEKQSPPETRPDFRGSTLPQEPNRKSPTLDQSTHVPSGSPEKQSPPQTRPDLRGSTLPQEPNRKSPTLDQSTHVPSGSPEKQSLSQPRPDIRPPQRSKSTSFDSRGNSFGRSGFYIGGFGQSKLWTDAKVEVFKEIDLHTPGSRGPTPPQQPNRKSPTLDQSTHVPNGSPEKQSPPQTRPDLRGFTLPQEPNRKSPTLDQSTHVPNGSPEKQSPPQPRPDLRGSTLPQEPYRKSPTLDQSTHGPRGSPEKQSPPQPRPDLRGSTLPQEPNRKSPTLDQSTHVPNGSPEKQSSPQTRPDLRGSTLPQEPNRKSPTLDQSTHVPSGSVEKQSPPQTRPDLRGSTLPQEPNRKSPTLDQSTHGPRGSPEKQSPPETSPDLRGSTLPQEPNRKSPTLDQSTHVPSGSPEKQSPPQTRPDLRGSTLPQEPNRKSPTLDQSTHVPSGSPEKQSLSQPRPDIRPPQRSKSTSFDSRGNSFGLSGFYIGGFGIFHWILGLLVLENFFATSTSLPIGIKEIPRVKNTIDDHSKGFGGKYGVQTDRVDKSAYGFEHQEKLEQHESQKVVLNYNKFGEDVYITCSTNDPSLIIETMRVTGFKEKNHALISYGKAVNLDKSKYQIEDIDGVRNLIIRNFSEEDRKYCYYCTIGKFLSACTNITVQINVDESCNNTGPPDQCKDPMSNCTEVSGDYKCSCNPGYYNNGGTCTITDQKGDNDKTVLIVGIVMGCVVLVLIVIAVFLYRRRKVEYVIALGSE